MKLKNILITGSSSGIGFYIAQSLSNLINYKVFLNGKNINKLKEAKKKLLIQLIFVATLQKIKI